jgi:hypothetical protein
VETEKTSGKLGASVKILGTGLTGATSVSFNGTVQVAGTPSGTLSTYVPYQVLP